MNKRCVSVIILAAIFLSVFSSLFVLESKCLGIQSLGTLSSCVIDYERNRILIRGSVKHSVLINNRDAKIAVYRFDPWVEVSAEILIAAPEAVTDMSIAFDFDLPCSTILQKNSLYAVSLIKSDGTVALIAPPIYPNVTTADTKDVGFKAVLTNDHAATVSSLPGSAVVDVYLDKLYNGNNSGYIFNADGVLFYFDKGAINKYDKIIRSYTASGVDVFLRFLISPTLTELSFCSDSAVWATNKCVVIDNDEALKAIYAYTSFLISRYNGHGYGSVRGIILGTGADMPVLYNYASIISEDYNSVYARSLVLIALAASEAAGNGKISLIVPISDTLSPAGRINGEEFVFAVADYLDTYSNVTFTVLCESRHNPYKISDATFSSDIIPEETTEQIETDQDYLPSEPPQDIETTYSDYQMTDFVIDESSLYDFVIEDGSLPETSEVMPIDGFNDSSEINEPPKFVQNNASDGYFCTDNIDVFLKMFEKLKKIHPAVNDKFAWCWYPTSDTVESALTVCYSYNYMKLASLGADFYAVGFEGDLSEHFSGLSHLFKYIDTSENIFETAYARSMLGISDWSEMIAEYYDGAGVLAMLQENELEPNISDFLGNLIYLDYSSGKGAVDWYRGHYCTEVALQHSDGNGYMSVVFDLDNAGFDQAEIGYIFDEPEPLFVGDALTFEVECGEDDGSLYEISIYFDYEGGMLLSKAVVTGGARCTLSANVNKCDPNTRVNAIRISLKRITGDGPCEFKLYCVSVNDYFYNDSQLNQRFDLVRNSLRAESEEDQSANEAWLYIGITALVGTGFVLLLLAYANDRKNKNKLTNT